MIALNEDDDLLAATEKPPVIQPGEAYRSTVLSSARHAYELAMMTKYVASKGGKATQTSVENQPPYKLDEGENRVSPFSELIHEVNSPLAILNMIIAHSDELSHEKREILTNAVRQISRILERHDKNFDDRLKCLELAIKTDN